jgi:transcriptional regulator with XRE-family HTH domain/NTP pyrophosphatase (non-canonical NTP hydrolase)
MSRDDRQARVTKWCAEAFGADHASSIPQRGLRLLEEALEAAQAAGVPQSQAHHVVDYVYGRPVGELQQELGGVGVTLLALAAAAGLSAEETEEREVARVLSKPLEHFRKRNTEKNEAGLEAQVPLKSIPPEALHYGDAIRLLRERKKMTLRALAQAVGVSAPFLSDLEHGRRRTDLHEAFAAALEVPEAELRALDGRITAAMKDWLGKNHKLVAFLDECRKRRVDPMTLVLK